MDIDFLVKLTSRAWALSILAALGTGTPGRQAPLLTATGANRTALGQSIAHLIDLGLLDRNPGHGHPLRPEYRLTETGMQAADMAARMMARPFDANEALLLRRMWTVPILTVCQTPHYFGDIKGSLSPITDRALSQSLKQLEAQHWVQRRTDTERYPPRPVYEAMHTGRAIGVTVHDALRPLV